MTHGGVTSGQPRSDDARPRQGHRQPHRRAAEAKAEDHPAKVTGKNKAKK
jgi:hypothetical protein